MVRRERDGELDDVAPAARRPAPNSLLSAGCSSPKFVHVDEDL